MLTNLYLDLPENHDDEQTKILESHGSTRVERIVSFGQSSPPGFWYDQDQNEWVIVLEGEAKLELEDESEIIHLKQGDYIKIPAHQRHRVQWTRPNQPTIWLAVFY